MFLTQKQDRPLKYETTRPVTAKQTSAKGMRNSTTAAQKVKGENNQTNHSNVADHMSGAEQPGNSGEVNENKVESHVQGQREIMLKKERQLKQSHPYQASRNQVLLAGQNLLMISLKMKRQ